MADVALSAQLQQWTFDKSRPERADSSASSPRLDQAENETLQTGIADAAAIEASASPDAKDTITLQECYLSSEEDLSPIEGDSSDSEIDDDVVSIHDGENTQARKMSMARFEKGKSLAVTVSYMSAGRPKVIDLASVGSPTRDTPQRSASLAELPVAAINRLKHLGQNSRMSLAVTPSSTRPVSPACIPEVRRPSTSSGRSSLAVDPSVNRPVSPGCIPEVRRPSTASRLSIAVSSSNSRPVSPGCVPEVRRPSTGHHFSHNNSSLRVSDSSSFTNSSSSRSSSPVVSERSRPASVAAYRPAMQGRSSLFISSNSNATQSRPFAPMSPISPDYAPSFLSSDPYENSTTSAASPIIKSSPHRRLRSISRKLALAKIAITPSTKKWDTRVNGRPNQMPPTPSTPYTPTTPQTAPPTGFAPPNRLRRNSRFSRPSSVRGPSPENIPAMPTNPAPTNYPVQKLVPRGANEREPTLELPPFPDSDSADFDPVASVKSKKIRKRKSLMDLLLDGA